MTTTVQAFTVFADLSIQWESPMAEILKAMELFAFDLDVVRVGCVASLSPVSDFAVRVFVIQAPQPSDHVLRD